MKAAQPLPCFPKAWVQLPLFCSYDFEVAREPGVVIAMPEGPQREARVALGALKRRESANPSVVIVLPKRPRRGRDYILDAGDPVEALALIMALKEPVPSASPLLPAASADPKLFVRRDVRQRAHENEARPYRMAAPDKAAAAPDRDKPKAPKQ